MKNLILSILLMNVLGLYSQNVRKILIVDNKGEAIPFVSIRLSDTYGVISDNNGCFILNKSFDKDSIVYISHIAFEPRQLMVNSIGDTIFLTSKQYSIDELVFSYVNIPELLTNAFKNTNYAIRNNYNSTRLFAVGDSLLYYNEKFLKLMKVDDKKIKTKTYSNIYYNVSTKDFYSITFPFSSTILKNPYWFYSSKPNLLKLIESSHVEKAYDDYYKLKAAIDSSVITMYISRKNGRLLRFEKSVASHTQKGAIIGETSYSYDFAITKNNMVTIKSFKYQSTIFPQKGSATICIKNYFSDILVDTLSKTDSLSFKTLKELEIYKQKQRIIDVDLYNYFNKPKPNENNMKNASSSLGYKSYLINRERINPVKHNVLKLNLPECNYMAIYNKSTMSYNYYPAEFKINFNLNSPRVANQHFSPIKMDSFNPYGTNKPQISLVLGVLDQFLKKIQE